MKWFCRQRFPEEHLGQESHSRVHYEVQVKGSLAGFQLLPGASVMSGAQVEASRAWGVVQEPPSAKR